MAEPPCADAGAAVTDSPVNTSVDVVGRHSPTAIFLHQCEPLRHAAFILEGCCVVDDGIIAIRWRAQGLCKVHARGSARERGTHRRAPSVERPSPFVLAHLLPEQGPRQFPALVVFGVLQKSEPLFSR